MECVSMDSVSFENIAPNIWLVRGHKKNESFGDAYDWGFVLIAEHNKCVAKMFLSIGGGVRPTQMKSIRKFIEINELSPFLTWERRLDNRLHVVC